MVPASSTLIAQRSQQLLPGLADIGLQTSLNIHVWQSTKGKRKVCDSAWDFWGLGKDIHRPRLLVRKMQSPERGPLARETSIAFSWWSYFWNPPQKKNAQCCLCFIIREHKGIITVSTHRCLTAKEHALFQLYACLHLLSAQSKKSDAVSLSICIWTPPFLSLFMLIPEESRPWFSTKILRIWCFWWPCGRQTHQSEYYSGILL